MSTATGPTLLCLDGGSAVLWVAAVGPQGVLKLAQTQVSRAHGARVLGMVKDVLEDAAPPAGVVVAQGPGSFTGLRTALATAKGLALGWGVPLFAVSTLHALARSAGAGPGQHVVACVDARKGQVYGQCWRLAADPAQDEPTGAPQVLPVESWLAGLGPHAQSPWAGNAAGLHPVLNTCTVGWAEPWPQPVALYACAVARWDAPDDLEKVEPLYVRQSYAELALVKPAAEVGGT